MTIPPSLRIVIFCIIFAVLYLVPLDFRPLFVPDETRYAEIPREMLSSGDWVVPKLDGFRYFEKPVLAYWLNALSMKIFGENEFAVRFPSALCAFFSSLMIYFFAVQTLKSRKSALLAAMIFLSSAEVFMVGTFSVTDMMLTFFLTGSICLFYLAYVAGNIFRKVVFLLLCGVFCGLAFLMKGFLAFAVPGLTILGFLIWERKWKEIFVLPWLPLVALLLVALPWCIQIHIRESAFWDYFFWVEHVGRFTSSSSGQHPQPFFFFIPVLLLGALPWTLFIHPVCSGLKDIILKTSLMKYLLCWLLIPFFFFSVSSGKLATYILPLFPALAILISCGLLKYFERGFSFSFERTSRICSWIFAFASVLLPLSQLLGLKKISVYNNGEFWKICLIFIALGTTAFLFRMASGHGVLQRRVIYIFMSFMPIFFVSNFVMPSSLIAEKSPALLITKNASRVKPDDVLVAYSSIAGAASWYLKRDDVYILHKPGEFEEGLKYPDSKHRLLSFKELNALIENPARTERIVLIMQHRDKREEFLPKGKYEENSAEYFFIEY